VQIRCVRSLLQSVHRAETLSCTEDCAAPAAGATGLHSPLATLQDGGAVLTRSAAHGRTMMSHPPAATPPGLPPSIAQRPATWRRPSRPGWARSRRDGAGGRDGRGKQGSPAWGEFASLTVQEACAESWSISASADPAGTRPRGWASAPALAASAW